jgi:FMN phosphatase YigB (HAD superfamily)
MTLNLLLDLDGTLLDNDQNAFFAAFASTLIAFLTRYAPADQLARGMQRGVQAMFLNDDPTVTLADAFYREFLAEIPPADRAAVRAEVATYYREIYPGLAAKTRPRPQAVELVEWAFSEGYRVCVATNPFFTTPAVEQRLSWAGLPLGKYPFALVTANESFHFAKSPAFYGEVMARLGWPDEPVLMVGDDLHLDVIAARAAGLPVFHVLADGVEGAPGTANGTGQIEDLRAWLEGTDVSQLKFSPESPEAILATLRSTPAGLAGLVADLPRDEWTCGPETDQWGLTEIFCHLRDVDTEVNLPRVQAVLEETNPFIAGRETDQWAAQRGYRFQNGWEALHAFAESRRGLAAILSGVSPTDWERPARHSIFGPTDLRELAAISAEHDRSHVRQARAALAHLADCRA